MGSSGAAAPSWARVYRSVYVYVEKEVAKLKRDVEKDGDKALAKVKVTVKAAAGMLKKVIRMGNKGFNQLPKKSPKNPPQSAPNLFYIIVVLDVKVGIGH